MDVPAGVTQEEGNTGFYIHLLSAVLALITFVLFALLRRCTHWRGTLGTTVLLLVLYQMRVLIPTGSRKEGVVF